jgi:predicted metal-dependent phosphoesterase TrpH
MKETLSRNGFGDLHLHTTASDGTQTIPQLVRRAKACALSVVAITDHDTISAQLDRRMADIDGLDVITGVELKADFGGVTGELLGYFVDPASSGLREHLFIMEKAREERMEGMIRRCCEHAGVLLEFADVRAVASGNLGRPHLARLLVDRGAAASFDEAFSDFIGKGRPCYVSLDKPDFRVALQLIHDAGGVASLAHPCLMRIDDWSSFLEELRRVGVDAIEAFYPYRTGGERGLSIAPRLLQTMAEEGGFLLTGGSDDHGPGSTKESIGTIRLPYERVEALKAALPVPLAL